MILSEEFSQLRTLLLLSAHDNDDFPCAQIPMFQLGLEGEIIRSLGMAYAVDTLHIGYKNNTGQVVPVLFA